MKCLMMLYNNLQKCYSPWNQLWFSQCLNAMQLVKINDTYNMTALMA